MFNSALLEQALITGESHDAVPSEGGPARSGSIDRAEEARLIAQIQAGNSEALADLVRPYLALFMSGIQRILQNCQETRATLQEALLSIHSELPRFLARDRFPTWAYRICLNEALLRRRSRMRQTEGSFEPFVQTGTWLDRAGSGTVAQEAATHADQTQIRDALTGLAEEQRLVAAQVTFCGI